MKVFTTIKSVLAAVLAVVAAFAVMTAALAIVGVLLLHFAPLCGEDTLSEKTAPDGKHVAVLMERNCGATTPYAYHINLRPASARFASGFFDGTVKDGEVVVSDRPPYYAWQDGATLVISPGGNCTRNTVPGRMYRSSTQDSPKNARSFDSGRHSSRKTRARRVAALAQDDRG